MSIEISEPIEAELCLAEGDLPFVGGAEACSDGLCVRQSPPSPLGRS
jgi:hypothetical protein